MMIKENEILKDYVKHLVEDEKSEATIEKYVRDVSAFLEFAGKISLSKELVLEYKSHLEEKGYQVTSINSMLVAVNGYLEFVGCPEYKVKTIRMQRKIYCEEERELTKNGLFRESHTLQRTEENKEKFSCVFHRFHAKIVAKQNHLTCSGTCHAFLNHLLKIEDGHILL